VFELLTHEIYPSGKIFFFIFLLNFWKIRTPKCPWIQLISKTCYKNDLELKVDLKTLFDPSNFYTLRKNVTA
jgi:hypothetical protein